MIKEYCEICGKEVVTDKYFLPVMKDIYARDRHGNPLIKTKTIGSEEKNVCKDCAKKIQFLIDCILPVVDENVLITFKPSGVVKSYRIEYIGDKL